MSIVLHYSKYTETGWKNFYLSNKHRYYDIWKSNRRWHVMIEVFDQWFLNHSKTIKTSTKKSIESKFNKHILPCFGKLKMKEITRPYCPKMINEIAQLITSVNDIKIQANQVFKYALKMDIISKNPLEHVSIPRQ